MIARVCYECASIFRTYPSKVGRYCSRACAGRVATETRAARMRATFVSRFWARVDRSGAGCWTWKGAANGDGYGTVKKNGKTVLAHRVSLALSTGEDIAGLALHSCDNPPCCRPDHLRPGSHKDNSDDRYARGGYRKGSRE